MCTCPPKYSLSPYTGCGHMCRYCYITSYVRYGFKPRVKDRFISKLLLDLRNADLSIPVSISNSSDPYTPEESTLKVTREVLRILASTGCKVIVLTKSSMVVRDIDILRRGIFTVSITITTLDDGIAEILEPYAPPPSSRIKALKMLSDAGIPCSARIDPIIPGINDDSKALAKLIGKLAEAGVKHIASSTYKAKPDNFRRLIETLPERSALLRRLYYEEGSIIHGVRYMPSRLRLDYMRMVKEVVEAYGITFSSCREGFRELQSSPTCDGTHLISSVDRSGLKIGLDCYDVEGIG
ncbi:MAG: radical SAM protein [Nitrososphaerota archaeon]|nr:radical SAM protein [Nitrososphaerota archaeon]